MSSAPDDRVASSSKSSTVAKCLSDSRRSLHVVDTALEADMNSPEVAALVAKDQAEARALGVSGTPGFFVNGRFLSGAKPVSSFQKLIDEELEKPKS